MNWIINNYYTKLMKDCEHGYQGGENPYHLEGSVYIHTQMVIKEMENLSNNPLLLAAAQLHDIGKPLARHEKNARAYFSGHEGISAYLALNYAKEHNLNPKDLFKLVALHGILYRYPKKEMIETSFTPDFWQKLSTLIKSDHLGRKTTQDKSQLLNLLNHKFNNSSTGEAVPRPSDPIKPRPAPPSRASGIEKSTLIILIGPPNSGKSTYINKHIKNYQIISRDALVLKFAKTDNYDEAFNTLTREQHEEINIQLELDYQNHLKEKKNIVIDMTNMSPKSRRKWTHLTKRKEYNIKFVLFLTPFDKIMERNKNRINKHIPENNIIMFMNKFTYPLPYKERYNDLEIILDEELCYQV